MSRPDVAGLIRRVRRVASLSQRELADALGVPQSTIARWELGRSEPTVSAFCRLLDLADADLLVQASGGGDVLEPM